VELAHFGEAPLTNQVVAWRISVRNKTLAEGKFNAALVPLGNGIVIGKIEQPLSAVTHPAKLELTVNIPGTTIRNDWSIWVYPTNTDKPTGDVEIFTSANSEFLAALHDGKNVLLLPDKNSVKAPIDGRFIPVFWSPLHFPNQPGTLGAMIDAGHPVWCEFPTDAHTDWQWWELLSHSYAIDLDGLSVLPTMAFRFVDKYNRNALPAALFEAKVGNGRLMVCTLDVTHDLEKRIVARQLRRSMLTYMGSPEFRPQTELSEDEIKSLFVTPQDANRQVQANAIKEIGSGFNDKK